MAIKSVKRKYSSINATGELQGRRTYKEVWVVVTDGVNVDPTTISADDRLPGKFSVYPSDAGAQCVKQDYDELDGNVWLVTCHYDSVSDDPERDGGEAEQLSWPPRYSIASTPYEKVLPKDFTNVGTQQIPDIGKAFLNSANQPFDEQVATVDDSRLIVTIQQIEATFPIETAFAYQKTVNSLTTTMGGKSFNPGTSLLYSISGSDNWRNAVHYWDVTYEFHIDRQGWRRKQLDKGAYYYQDDDTADEDKKTYFSEENPSEEKLLNGLGGKLPVGEDPVFIEFIVFEEKDHTVLGFS